MVNKVFVFLSFWYLCLVSKVNCLLCLLFVHMNDSIFFFAWFHDHLNKNNILFFALLDLVSSNKVLSYVNWCMSNVDHVHRSGVFSFVKHWINDCICDFLDYMETSISSEPYEYMHRCMKREKWFIRCCFSRCSIQHLIEKYFHIYFWIACTNKNQ